MAATPCTLDMARHSDGTASNPLGGVIRKAHWLPLLLITASLVLPLQIAAQGNRSGDEVRTQEGQVRGNTANGVTSFKGIPYAAPPVGVLRWREPQPVKPWSKILDATKFGPSCMQTDDLPKSEDCLTLNLWRPANASSRLPVMVWIYGGALAHGNTPQYPGDALARQGVIVVSMNYRMGRFGFFAHPALTAESPDEVHGNYGYLDQIAALKWVQRNIEAFGGDPKNVTIFGESAGGGSVMVHLISPLSRGLFARAILESPGIPTARSKSLPLTPFKDAEVSGVAYAKPPASTVATPRRWRRSVLYPQKSCWSTRRRRRCSPVLPPAKPFRACRARSSTVVSCPQRPSPCSPKASRHPYPSWSGQTAGTWG